ncbi:GGDEF domain-containing protein [Methylobacterium sp. J-030]|uniref:GGDEF domain-containing protein n=1 Tax=Methylobacterium sp. J-030 TaxID=2836627 RepID=UPI001FBB33B8|nr:GGDEF domain-containing protein [Methylobacterium sp. J-030]MCJ2069033.1 GGDEF domain-containing protein [Methylobacterium sp. J-030]
MLRRFGYPAETNSLFIALVDELATGVFPAAIMAVTYCGVASVVAFRLGSPMLWVIALTGTIISGSKCLIKRCHQRALRIRSWTRQRAARWEWVHTGFTLGFAAHIGCVAACGFLASDPALPILVTGLVFGYCSGTVTRISFRPVVAGAAISIATVPGIAATALRGDVTSIAIATVFTVFLCGGFETIRYLYRNTRRQIILRHDMATLAKNDPLTRLLNRLGLREAFRAVVAEARGNAIAVHCLDLDGFKPVNDQYGHAAGDLLLQAIADRLRAVAPTKAAIARVGGDEFVIVHGPLLQPDEAERLAQQLDRAITEPFLIQGREIRVGTSIGIATAPPGSLELDPLLAAADAELYRAKKGKGGRAARPVPRAAADHQPTLQVNAAS